MLGSGGVLRAPPAARDAGAGRLGGGSTVRSLPDTGRLSCLSVMGLGSECYSSLFRTVIDIGLSTSSGFQLVIPFPMKFIGDQRHRVHLLLGDRDARGIVSVVDFRLDPEPFGRPRVPDAVHDGFVRRQRRAAPVRRDGGRRAGARSCSTCSSRLGNDSPRWSGGSGQRTAEVPASRRGTDTRCCRPNRP